MSFGAVDAAIVALYLVGMVAFGIWAGRGQKDTNDYFLGGKDTHWLPIALSIVGTETSVLTFISIPAVAYAGDLTFLQLVVGYLLGRVIIAVVMLPAYARGNMATAYQFFGERFGPTMRKLTGLTFMATRILADGVRAFATAIPLAIVIKGSGALPGVSDPAFYAWSIVIIGAFSIVYTYLGGLKSVIWVEVIQTTTYVVGALLAAVIILYRLPEGWASVATAAQAGDKLRWFWTGFELPLSEMITKPYALVIALVGGAVFSLASHGTDQLMVQRLLACRSLRDGQKAIVASGVIVLLQFIVFLLVGVMLFAFYGGAPVAALGVPTGDGIFPKFIVEEIPTGLSGLIVAALLAAAMSLSSTLSSLSSVTVLDLYAPLAGPRSEAHLLLVSRIATLVWGVVLTGVALCFIGLQGTTVIELALGIASYTYGGLLGAFFLGLISRRARERDAIIGFAAALVVLTVLIQTVSLAWPLYTVVGSLTAIVVGIACSRLLPQPRVGVA